MPGLFGLELMPRNRALLSFRADHSVKKVLGAKIAASLTMWMAALSMVSVRHGRHADRNLLLVLGFFLRRDGDGRHPEAHGVVLRRALPGGGACARAMTGAMRQ